MRGPSRATAALCALLATAGTAHAQTPADSPAPAPQATAAPPEPQAAAPMPTTRIFITSTRPGLKLYQSADLLARITDGNTGPRINIWQDFPLLCEAPCNHEASLDSDFVVDGEGIARSGRFRLPPAPGATGYRIDVRAGSSAGRTVSILTMLIGTAAIVTGIALHVDANQALSQYEMQHMTRPDFSFSDNDRQHQVATGLLLGGWAVLIGGGLGLGLSSTNVDVKPVSHGRVIVIPGGLAF